MDNVMYGFLISVAILGVIIIFKKPILFTLKLLASSVIGLAGMLMINAMNIGIFIGANYITALVCGFLGLPGLIMIMILQIIL